MKPNVNACKLAGRVLADVERMSDAHDKLARMHNDIDLLGDFYQEATVSLEIAALKFEHAKDALAALAGTLIRLYNEEIEEDSSPEGIEP